MAMEQPHAGIVRPKAKNDISAPRDLHGVSPSGASEVVRIGVIVIVIVISSVTITTADDGHAGWKGIFEGVV
jgi:hypothetical protein